MGAVARLRSFLGMSAAAAVVAAPGTPSWALRQFAPNGGPADHRYYRYYFEPDRPGPDIWPHVQDEILRDATVFGASHMLHSQLCTAKWRSLPGSERVHRWARHAMDEVRQAVREESVPNWVASEATYESRRNADHANENFGWAGHSGRAQESWEESLGRMLPYVEYGHRALIVQYHAEDSRAWVSRFDDLDPHCYDDPSWTDDGQMAGLPLYDRDTEVPAERLLWLTFRQQGRNVRGVGFTEAAYPWWELKRHSRGLLAVAADRWAVATPVVNVDRKLAMELGYNDDAIEQMVSACITAAVQYSSGESRYLIQNPGVQIGVFGNNNFDPTALAAVVRLCDEQILMARIMRFMLQNHTTTAPLSNTVPAQADFRLGAANNLDLIASRVGGRPGPGRGAHTRALEFSYGPQRSQDLPLHTHSGIHEPALMRLLPHLPHLRNAGMATPTNRLEELIMEIVGEVMPPEAWRDVEDRLATKNNEVSNTGKDTDPSKGGMPAAPSKEAA